MRLRHKILSGIIAISCLGILLAAYAADKKLTFGLLPPEPAPPPLAMPGDSSTTLPYPIQDRTGDFVTDQPNNPFYLKDPSAIQENVEYDPTTGMYVLTEQVDGQDIKPPMYMTYDDYLKYTEQQAEKKYWDERANAVALVEDKGLIPPIQLKKDFVNRLFGSDKIEIRPQGSVDMTLGANLQRTENPNIPLRNRNTGGFDFDMHINMNVIGKIGDKLQLALKYNTQSGFQFDNTVKLGYTGGQDDIIKSIEAGNVSFALPTRLITGSQSLFGVKTQLQFGRLTWTTVVSQQQSKKQTLTLDNGAQQQSFSINSDAYDQNRNFFLAQYFVNTYDQALTQLPNILTEVNITRIEVWVTDRTGVTQNVRNIVGMADLGEQKPASPYTKANGSPYPDNSANNLYARMLSNPNNRFVSNNVTAMQALGQVQGQDFEVTYARQLNPNEFTYNKQLGYIMLNAQLNPSDVLGVAFQYEYNGRVFQVGEFGDQVPPDSNAVSKALYVKLLKGTTELTNFPIWNLEMKNIYSLGAFNISSDNFRLDIYYNDPGGGLKRYIPTGCLEGHPLLEEENLDNLDLNNNPQPDGLFDFLPGIDINPQNGKLIFPVLQPFGHDLAKKMTACGSGNLVSTYTYQQLYDSTQFIALQYPQNDRFVIKGTYKGTGGGNSISLGAGNIPRGSVTVTAGGQKLTEGADYTVDYNLGRVTILNQSVINSGQQIQIQFENNNLFATQVQTMYGTRFDYKVSPKLNLGATLEHLSERPFTQKVNIGDDPISNTIMGADIKYTTNVPWLTKALNVLPFYKTKEMSTFTAYGEFAYLKPGESRAIKNPMNKESQVYIDDFEGTSTGYDLKVPTINWKLASAPRYSPGPNGRVMFPEAELVNDERYGYNRALLAWYSIDNSFYNQQTSPAVVYGSNGTSPNVLNHYARLIPIQEVFPNQPTSTLDQNLYTFDMAYFPNQRGPYNFEASSNGSPGISAGINNDGTLKSPASRWGGIMEAMTNTDFQSTNVQYIEFWMMDPFLYNKTSKGGYLYIDLGYISEDILRDSRMAFENGIVSDHSQLDSTFWGLVPKIPPLVNAFDNDPTLRPIQDVGLDGTSDAEEKMQKKNFLNAIQNTVTSNPSAVARLQNDPATDDYVYFYDPSYANVGNGYTNNCFGGVIERYKYYEGTEGNSPVQTNTVETTAATPLPDKEDLNNDNTLNENEEYFQYAVHLTPDMTVGSNPYIVAVEDASNDPQIGYDQNKVPARWLQFRIPVQQYTSVVGNISDFLSIQFMRMFLAGWEDSIVLRFGTLQLDRNQWIIYNQNLDDACENLPNDNNQGALFSVTSVGIENNSAKVPVNYVLPPYIYRQTVLGTQTNQFIQQDEQSLDLQVGDLQDCQNRAVFKNVTLDLRNYKTMLMYLHANRVVNEPTVKNKDVTAFIRIGSDFTDNYYEYQIPLDITPDGSNYNTNSLSDQLIVWPDSNNMSVNLQDFVKLKEKRNATAGFPHTVPFQVMDHPGGHIMTIVGNPDIGNITTIMLGIRNPGKSDPENPLINGNGQNSDDGQPKYVEVWFDELRLSGFNEQGGVAAVSTANLKVADFGTVNLSGAMHTQGFGQVEQRLDQRYKDNLWQYNFTTNFELGKLFPAAWGLHVPFYANYAQSFSTPQYDPFQLDITTKYMVQSIRSTYGADSARNYLQTDRTLNTTRGFNFTNMRIVPKSKSKTPKIYDLSNFNFTYSYNQILESDPFTARNSKKTWLGLAGWNYAPKTKNLAPFRRMIKSKSKWLDIFRDFAFNPIPSTLSVSSGWNRILNDLELRQLPAAEGDASAPLGLILPSYSKDFNWTRAYTIKWNPFKALSIDLTANDIAHIDEPDGLLNTPGKRDTVWGNVLAGGRNTSYNQNLAVNYALPINKLPAFDFITANVGYSSTYAWTALPWQYDTLPNGSLKLSQNALGNIINNTQNDVAKVDFNFKKLYDKSTFLKVYDSPNPDLGDRKANQKKRDATRKARDKIRAEIKKLEDKREKLKEDLKQAQSLAPTDTTGKQTANIERIKKELKANAKAIRDKKKELRSKQYPSNPIISAFLRPLLMLKKVTADWKENKGTTLPGFEGYSQILGNQVMDNRFTTNPALMNSPGFGFVFGQQPGDTWFGNANSVARTQWLNAAASKGWISKDSFLNQPFTQLRSQRIDGTASFEPWPDFKIDLTMFYSYTDNYSEFFKYLADSTNPNQLDAEHLNPMDIGTYSISYLPIKTAFASINEAGYSAIYNRFVANRAIISQRLGAQNPNSLKGVAYFNPSDTVNGGNGYNTSYTDGYGPLSQDVLIPAFLAAYEQQNPNKTSLNPFKSIPYPNWRIAYTGLSKFKWIKKIFTNVTVSHAYSSTMSISSFQTNLSYTGDGSMLKPSSKDSIAGNFNSLYNIPSIVINEQFSPLLGIDATLKNNVTAKASYSMTRTMTLSFADFQLIQMQSKTLTVGAGYKIKGLKLPVRIKGRKIRLDNDLNFRFDFSYQNNVTVNYLIDQAQPQITQGNEAITISPSVDYVVSKRLSIKLFFNQTRTIPKISSSFPTTNTQAGLTLRFSLAD